MKKNGKLNEISRKLEEYKTESEIRSDFIKGRIKRFNYRALKDNNVLDYEMYSLIKIVVCITSLSPIVGEDIQYRFSEMWLNHKLFFKKKRFECVIIAFSWYCTRQEKHPVDKSELVKMFFKDEDQTAMLRQVSQCESRILKYYGD